MSHPDIIGGVLGEVSAFYGVSVADIVSGRRTRHILPARQAAIYLARKLSEAQPQEIGKRFGGRDYTIVLMTCRAIGRLLDEDARQAALFADLETRCRQMLLRGAS